MNAWQYCRGQELGRARWYQGIIAVSDCPEEVGGFRVVPGSHRFLEQWIQFRDAPTRGYSHRPKQNDPLCAEMQRIPLRRG